MRPIPIVFHLNIYKLAFHLKFPATITLELQIDKQLSLIADDIPLGKETITINKQIKHQTCLIYQESAKRYEEKKISIIISIKTKTSENRLTAGVLPITLCKPSAHVTNQKAKPLRCNDPKAFIEYSLRTEKAYKSQPKNETNAQTEAIEPLDSKQTTKNIFKSAVHYNNHQQEINTDNELQKYLGASISRVEHQDRRKYKSSHKITVYSIHNCEEDDSRTEKMSYRKEKNVRDKDCSISSSQENQYERKANQLSRKSDVLSKQANQSKFLNQNLKAQNKQLRAKIKKCEKQLDQQSSLIISLNRKLELKDNFSHEQTKQLKLKLQQTETQLHQIMMEKNLLLNQWEAKEKEIMILFKGKEKALIEGKKKLVIEMERKSQSAESLKNDLEEMQLSEGISQKIISSLRQENKKLEEKLKDMVDSVQDLRNEVAQKNKSLEDLQLEVKNKVKLIEEQKVHKKTIFQLKQERDEKERQIKQNGLLLHQLQGKLKEKDEVMAKNAKQHNFLTLQCQSLRQKIKEQSITNVQITKKVRVYENQLRRTSQNSNKISTQIKDFETELNQIKKQANTGVGEKSKLIAQYERFISVLKDKIEMILQEKSEAEHKYEETNKLLRNKEDEWYELGQQLIFIKDQNSNLIGQNQMLRQENAYLNKSITQLTQKEEKLLRLQQKLQYNDRLYEELQQRFQLQRIQLENEIRSLQQKNEEKYYALSQASEQLRKAEREELYYRDQIETLRLALNNKVSELNYIKIQSERYRQNNIQFQERMATLRRIQDTATTSIQELKEENITFKNMIKENQEAITTLGKRHDRLYKSTIQSLNQIMEILKSQKMIGNSFVRHEKPEISSIMNDFIRFIAIERENNSQQISNLKQQLSTEIALNKENAKVIKVKSQIQAEQEEEIRSIKALTSNLEDKIAKLQNDIYLKQKEIKEKQGSIADLHRELERAHKQHKSEIQKKDEAISQVQAAKDKLNQQLQAQAEKYNLNNQKWKVTMQSLQNDMNSKITSLNEATSLLNNDLKSERDATKQLKGKISELQLSYGKLNKQREQTQLDVDRRVKELIATRIECDNTHKKIIEKEEMVSQCNKKYLKLQNDNAKQMAKMQRIQAEYKESCIKKSEFQATLKEKNNEILALKLRIEQGQDARNKLVAKGEELIKSKATQESLVSSLNQTIKTLKEANIKNEQAIKKISFQKQCVEKDFTKKINIMINEKSSSQKLLSDYRTKTGVRQVQQSSKEKKLSEELKTARLKLTEQAATIEQLSSELQDCNKKLSNLTSELSIKSAELQSKQRILLPNSVQIKEIIQSVSQLRTISKQYETNKNKLLKTCQLGLKSNESLDYACQVARQLNICINRIKIQVLNKLKLTTEVKTVMLDELKKLQVVIEKLERSP